MPKFIRPLFSALLIAAVCSSFASAQNDPGSIDDLLDIEFAPLQTETQPQSDLNAPLIIGQQPEQQAAPEQMPQPQSVLEIPRVSLDEPAPDALVLPNLTVPTPENSGADMIEDRTVRRPQITVRPEDEIELLSFDNQDRSQIRSPRMQTPRALPYGSNAIPGRLSRIGSQIFAVPVQVEFSVPRGFGYQPYGGYGGYRSYGSYRPYGGYAPNRGYGRGYGGYGGRNCPYGR